MYQKKWFTRLLILIAILLPAPALVQYLQAFIVRNAVVTAHLYEIRAPIDGVVATLDAHPGSIPGKAPLVILRNTRMPHADVDSLEARYQESIKTHAFLQQELDALKTRMAVSQHLLADYRTALEQDLEQTVGILKTRLAGEKAHLHEARQLWMRNIQLRDAHAVSLADIDRLESELHLAESLVQSNQLEQKQIQYRRQILRKNLFPSTLSDGILQVLNQIKTLDMAILDYKRRINASESVIAGNRASLQAARADLERRSTAVIQLPDSTVIWEVNVRTGAEIGKGDRILSYIDRSDLMVDVAMDDATIALIHPGHPVRIRLFGSGRFINGKVISVLGSAAARPDGHFAAGVKIKSARDGRVLVRIDDPGLYQDVGRFCGVGRAAYARFEGIGLIEQYLGGFLR